MARKIVVTGGTGTLGVAVVDLLLRQAGAGDEIVVVSRRARPRRPTAYTWATVDYGTGAGLDDAVAGADVILHLASDQRAVDLDRAVIAAAERVTGVHLVNISIVGVGDIRFGYYQRKLAIEQMITASGVRWTNLRTTQFHDLAATICRALTRLPVVFAPTISLQPIEVREVAARLVELAAGEPVGRATDMGGPQVLTFAELLRIYQRSRGLRRPMVPLSLPVKAFRDYRRGYHLAADHAVGRSTFADYLAAGRQPA